MPRMFLSYRRADAAAITGRIFDRLVARYGRDVVFMDIDDIPIGTDFKKYVDGILRKCDVLLAVVGTKWLGAEVVGTPRIFVEADPVRNELLSALRLNIPIIPVLVDGAKMPEEKDLPNDLKMLLATLPKSRQAGTLKCIQSAWFSRSTGLSLKGGRDGSKKSLGSNSKRLPAPPPQRLKEQNQGRGSYIC